MPVGLPFQMSPQTAGKGSSSLQTWWVVSLGRSKDTLIRTLASLLCPLSYSGKKGKLLRETVYSFLILMPLWGTQNTYYFCDEEEKDWKARWLLLLMLSPLPVALYKSKLEDKARSWASETMGAIFFGWRGCSYASLSHRGFRAVLLLYASPWLDGARASQATVASVGPPSSVEMGWAPQEAFLLAENMQ